MYHHLPIIIVAPAKLQTPQLIREADSSIIARVPALRVFGLRARVGGHRDAAKGVELKTGVGVAYVELDGRPDWRGEVGIVDDYGGDVPG
jgi:hypothetical protein